MSNPVLAALGRPFRPGTVGGAPPSMIGPVHRVASMMDQRFEELIANERARDDGIEAHAITIPMTATRYT
jgi:hypothetical protein